jgi:apolipoprotein N-acyltransferase
MKINKISTQIFLAVLSGILLAASFPPLPLPILAFVGLVPLLTTLFYFEKTKISKYLLVYLTFFVYHAGTLWWISSWSEKTDTFLLLAGLALDIFHPFFFFVPFIIYFMINKRLNKILSLYLFPAIYLIYEWAFGLGDMGFTWMALGNTQMLNIHWIQFIDITGIWGASALILFTNVFITHLLILYAQSERMRFLKFLINNKTASWLLIGISIIIFAPYFYSLSIIQKYDYKNMLKKNKLINVAVVQPNINPWDKWESDTYQQYNLLLHLSDSIMQYDNSIDLLVFPETALPLLSYDFNTMKDVSLIKNWCKVRNAAILTGLPEFEFLTKSNNYPPFAKKWPNDTNLRYYAYNSSILIPPDSTNFSVYRKSRLTPFAEYVPYQDVLPVLLKWINWGVGISNWNKGQGPQTMTYNRNDNIVNVGNIICIESIYPDYVAKLTKKGANLLTVITNDGWYDHTIGPRQHYYIAVTRAIENRRFLARAANTGVSGFISPYGVSLQELPQYQQASTNMMLPLIEEQTIYTKYGDWIIYVGLSYFIILLLIAIIQK